MKASEGPVHPALPSPAVSAQIQRDSVSPDRAGFGAAIVP